MRNADGQVTNKRARAQVLIFNALSKVFVRMDRRSHDKMLVIDGRYPDKAIVLTGGRNVSLDYYGIFKFQTQPAMLMYDPDRTAGI